MIKGVIFDLDGTLLNTLEDICDSLNGALSNFNFPAIPLSQCRVLVGNGEKDLVWGAMPDETPDALVDEVLAEYKRIYAKSLTIKTRKYDGIDELLDVLDKASIRYAILSNKENTLVGELAAFYFRERKFTAVIGYAPGRLRKPDPDGVIRLIDVFGYEKQEVVLIGDSVMDMLAAKGAGIAGIGACWGYQSRNDLLSAGAGFLAENPSDAGQIII